MSIFASLTDDDWEGGSSGGWTPYARTEVDEMEVVEDTDSMFATGLSPEEQETDAMFAEQPVPLQGERVERTPMDFEEGRQERVSPGMLDRPPADDEAQRISMTLEPEQKQQAPGLSIDNSFLEKVEGFETSGYVPQQNGEAMGQSGVTIASGLDLGQHDQQGLRKMGLPEGTIAKLTPYLGKKKGEAIELLAQRPLQLDLFSFHAEV